MKMNSDQKGQKSETPYILKLSFVLMPKAPSNLIFYLQIALSADHQESNNVTTALVESPPHSVCCSSIKTKSELHFGSDDSGHHEEHSSSSPASSRTSHYDCHSEADHDLGELCLGNSEGIEDSISSGSDSGFGHKKSPSYCSRCSEDSCEDYQKPVDKKPNRGRKSGVKKASLILRKHSRASSVDRREIFNKYIQKSSEHTDSIRPFSSDDPELCHEAEKDRNQEEFLLVHEQFATKNSEANSNQKKEFRLVRLTLDEESLGIFLARQNQVEIGCHGYFVVYILRDGLVTR